MGGKAVYNDGSEIKGETLYDIVTRLEEAALMHLIMDRLGVDELRFTRADIMRVKTLKMTRWDEAETGDIVFTR